MVRNVSNHRGWVGAIAALLVGSSMPVCGEIMVGVWLLGAEYQLLGVGGSEQRTTETSYLSEKFKMKPK